VSSAGALRNHASASTPEGPATVGLRLRDSRNPTLEACVMPSPIQPGQVLNIPEASYLYGVGDLRLRVTEVGGVQHLPDGAWLTVKGMQLRRDGTEMKEREVLVRVSPAKRRPEV